jgi:hypothetical protein
MLLVKISLENAAWSSTETPSPARVCGSLTYWNSDGTRPPAARSRHAQ